MPEVVDSTKEQRHWAVTNNVDPFEAKSDFFALVGTEKAPLQGADASDASQIGADEVDGITEATPQIVQNREASGMLEPSRTSVCHAFSAFRHE